MRFVTVTCTYRSGVQYVIVNGNEHALPSNIIGKTETLAFAFKHIINESFDIAVLIDDDLHLHYESASLFFAQELYDDDNLGVICGNREFVKTDTLPNAVRHVWGVVARPIMKLCRIPYGGYMAIRAELISDFVVFWEQSVFDDTKAAVIAERRGYGFKHAGDFSRMPDVTDTDFKDLWEFVVRQYADVRVIGPWKLLLFVWFCVFWYSSQAYYYLGFYAPLIYLGLFLLPSFQKNWRVLLGIPIVQLYFLIGVPYAGLVRTIKWKHLTVDLKRNRFIRNG